MKFFNKKEDVLDIQLTQYGKHLLSKGELEPTYYAFFDDDVSTLGAERYADCVCESVNAGNHLASCILIKENLFGH